jgi:hypothetical protein
MLVLDVVSRFRSTEAIFRGLDAQAGECVLCNALFESLRDVSARYGLDLDELLLRLETAAQSDSGAVTPDAG